MSATPWGKLKEIGRDTAIYGGAEGFLRVAALLISLVTVPVYTRVFTPRDYGLMELLVNAGALIMPLLTLSFDQALTLAFYDDRDASEQRALAATGFHGLAVWAAAVAGLLVACAGPIGARFAFPEDAVPLLRIVIVTAALAGIAGYGKLLLRLTSRPFLFAGITVLTTLCTSLAGLFAVVFLGMRLRGIFMAAFAVHAVAFAATVLATRDMIARRPRRRAAGRFLALAPPLLGSSVILTLTALTDRYFLVHAGGLDSMGIYSVALRFSALLTTALTWISMAWTPLILKTDHSGEPINPLLEKVAHYLLAAFFVAGFAIAAFSRQALWLLATPAFQDAYLSVAPLCLAVVYTALQAISLVGLQTRKRVRLGVAFTLVHFAATAGLCTLLTPRYGAPGTAAATAGANLLFLALTLRVTIRTLDAPSLASRRTLFAFALFSALIAGLPFFRPESVWIDAAAKAAALAGMVLLLFRLRLIDGTDVAMFRRFVERSAGKLRGARAADAK